MKNLTNTAKETNSVKETTSQKKLQKIFFIASMVYGILNSNPVFSQEKNTTDNNNIQEAKNFVLENDFRTEKKAKFEKLRSKKLNGKKGEEEKNKILEIYNNPNLSQNKKLEEIILIIDPKQKTSLEFLQKNTMNKLFNYISDMLKETNKYKL